MVEALAIEAHQLTKRFGKHVAVDAVDLRVPGGCIYGLLGTNGAGKSTTLRMLLGITEPDHGSRSILGSGKPLSVARQVGYLPEERGLYPALSAREGIAFLGALRGLPLREGRARATTLLADYGLPPDRPIKTLSKGMAQLVQILGTIVHQPRLIVLDEPFAGLDAVNQGRLEGLLRAQVAQGVTVLFSTHIMAHAERLCDRIAILGAGRVQFEGKVADALDLIAPQVTLSTHRQGGDWRLTLPADARWIDDSWRFSLPTAGIESILRPLMAEEAGIRSLSIERASLHDVFMRLVETTQSEEGATRP